MAGGDFGREQRAYFQPPDNGMDYVIIPFDYEQLPYDQREGIVPICIASVDRSGNPVARVWFEQGVSPIQDRLRDLARYKLGDVRHVSELAEITVHKLWERHGENAGSCPRCRVWARAVWGARDLAAGVSRWLLKHSIPLALGALERDLYGNGLADPRRYDAVYERELLIALVERRMAEDRREDIREAFKMLRQGYTWDEIATRLQDPNPEAVKKRFWRWAKRNFR
jgi:hypothetical protein